MSDTAPPKLTWKDKLLVGALAVVATIADPFGKHTGKEDVGGSAANWPIRPTK